MNFSIAKTIRRLLAPRHELSCPWWLWRGLIKGLRERGRGQTRESGAFLLGHRDGGRSRIVDFVLYDDLDPHCLDSGIIRFNGKYFGPLWDICKRRGLTVVADIHVHPGCEAQSDLDRAYPMISMAGHLALIVPDYARSPVNGSTVGIYRYRGSKLWDVIPKAARNDFLFIGI